MKPTLSRWISALCSILFLASLPCPGRAATTLVLGAGSSVTSIDLSTPFDNLTLDNLNVLTPADPEPSAVSILLFAGDLMLVNGEGVYPKQL